MAIEGEFRLDADLVARVVIASAQTFGDDPAVALTTKSSQLRRSLSPAGCALNKAGTPFDAIERMLGVKRSAIFGARCRQPEGWARAQAAAARVMTEALSYGAPEPVAIEPASAPSRPAVPTEGKRTISAGAARREIRELLETDNLTAPQIARQLRLGEAQVREALVDLRYAGEAKPDALTAEGWRVQTWRRVAA